MKSDTAILHYKVDNYYSQEHERGIIYDDSQLVIDWEIPEDDIIVSIKYSELPKISELND